MVDETTRVALIDEIGPLTTIIDRLKDVGIEDDDVTVLSGQPHTEHAMGRSVIKTDVPFVGITGFLVGLGLAFILVWGTPLQYPLVVGGQPILPIPPLLVLGFEFSMLGLLVGTFLGVFWESGVWSADSRVYHTAVSDGKNAVVFSCQGELFEQVKQELGDLDVEWVEPMEVKIL